VHTNASFGISNALAYADQQPDGDLSRAWCWRRLAESIPPDDPRAGACAAAAQVHAAASLPYVTGDDYMVGHWLAAYAVLLFS
jgi:hypothetical protein